MILNFIEIFNVAAVKTLLVGIPESAGLLLFGLVLVVTAVFLRRLLRRGDAENTNDELGKKA